MLILQSRQADKHFAKIAKKFTDLVYKQMGVQVFMLVGYQNSEGDFVRSKYVFMSSPLYFEMLTSCQSGNQYPFTNKEQVHIHLQQSWWQSLGRVGQVFGESSQRWYDQQMKGDVDTTD